MKILIMQCSNCGDYLFSRAQHDFRYCSCRKSAVDSGLMIGDFWVSYRQSGLIDNEWFAIDLDVTASELYNDWNNNEYVYGLYKNDR